MNRYMIFICLFLFTCSPVIAQVETVRKLSEVQWINNDTVCYYNGNPYTGEIINFSGVKFDKTKLLYDGHFKSGQRNGTIKRWYPNFKIESVGNYKMGIKNGIQTYYYENGNNKAEYLFLDGVPDGTWNEWFENKQLKSSLSYSLGTVKDGSYITYLANGLKESETIYQGGKIITSGKYVDGKYIKIREFSVEHYPNGQNRSEGSIISGKKEGLWTIWYEGGKKESEENYSDGIQNGPSISWYENGRKNHEGIYIIGAKDGLWTYWYEGGQKKGEGNYKNGLKDGNWHTWFDNGQLEFDGNYLNDIIEGYATLYYSTSGEVYQGEWRMGKRSGRGKYHYPHPNGDYYTYTGYFVRDKFEGQGKLIRKDGVETMTASGEFRNGKIYNGTIRSENTSMGQISENKVTNGKWGSSQIIDWGNTQHPH